MKERRETTIVYSESPFKSCRENRKEKEDMQRSLFVSNIFTFYFSFPDSFFVKYCCLSIRIET